MAVIKGLIKEKSLLQKAMDKLNDKQHTNSLRKHLGLSMIGHKCHRYLQYNHYDAFEVTHSTRILRLFGEGHRMEPVLRNELGYKLGIKSFDDQFEVVGFAGHWKGHIDGKGYFLEESEFKDLIDDIFLVEFKTHNDKSFKDLKKNKVKVSKPAHYAQMQTYMDHCKLTHALYVAYNKNDSEIYLEVVEHDPDFCKDLKRKEGEVIMADELLPRIGNDSPAWFECKMCDARKVCFNKEEPKKSCKNCEHADILDDGVWKCGEFELDVFDPCGDYKKASILCQK